MSASNTIILAQTPRGGQRYTSNTAPLSSKSMATVQALLNLSDLQALAASNSAINSIEIWFDYGDGLGFVPSIKVTNPGFLDKDGNPASPGVSGPVQARASDGRMPQQYVAILDLPPGSLNIGLTDQST